MSRENVEIVLGGVGSFNAGDWDAFVALWDPECEFFSLTGSQMNAHPYRGHEGIRRYVEETKEAWTELRLDIDRTVEAENGVVLVLGRLRGTGRGSGALVEQQLGIVYTVRGGSVRSCRAYSTPSEALEAVGLSE
jgi:ketosteroid isomerase-like protein